MKQMVKLIIKYLSLGISYGCTFFVCTCLILFLAGGEKALIPITQNFSHQAIGAVLTGIACASTAIVYEFDNISFRYKVLIHVAVGMGTFYPVAFSLKWISFYPEKIWNTVIQILITCGIFAIIWLIYFFLSYMEARKINQRLKEMENSNL